MITVRKSKRNVKSNPGKPLERIQQALDYLCSPDPGTRTPEEEGRRLVQLGPFSYRVVNYAYYRGIRDEEERREQNWLAQERYRDKLRRKAEMEREMEGMTPEQRKRFVGAYRDADGKVRKPSARDRGDLMGRRHAVADAVEGANGAEPREPDPAPMEAEPWDGNPDNLPAEWRE